MITAMLEGEIIVDISTGIKEKKEKRTIEEVASTPEVNKTTTVIKQFVVDYTSETFEPLMEYEINGLDYRYVYGNDRLRVDVKGITSGSGSIIENGDHIRLYYHMDYLGTVDYLTNPIVKKIVSWTHYNEWGEITHNAVLKTGQRELDLVKRYGTHDYDSVLNIYYAKARFYDPIDRRFTAMDPILDASKYSIENYIDDPMQLVQYLYVKNNPVVYVDPDGEIFALATAVVGAAVGAAVGAYKSYKDTGKVSLKSVAKGAAVGAIVGAGALTGAVLAGSATAPTAAVVAEATKVAVATSTAIKTVVSGIDTKAVDVAANVVNEMKAAITTAVNKIGQGINAVKQVGNVVNTKTTQVATKIMSTPGKAGTVTANILTKPDVAMSTGLSGISTVAGAKKTYDYIVAKEYKNATITLAFTVTSAYFGWIWCKELTTDIRATQVPVVKDMTDSEGTGKANENIVYRALNQKDAERLSQGLGLEAKNPAGTWKLDEHLVGGSSKASWSNDPFISTTADIDVARGFNQSGSNLGIVKIDLNKVPSQALKGYEIYPRVNGVEGLPYHYSIWQQETSVYQSIPIEAIKGFVK